MADERPAMLTVQELASKVQKKEVSPVEVTDAVIARIERLNPTINAYTTLALWIERATPPRPPKGKLLPASIAARSTASRLGSKT